MTTSIDQLKAAIQKEFSAEGPELIAEINQNLKKLDGILDKLDRKLADSLAKAHSTKDPAARKTELNNSKTILADYIKYVRCEGSRDFERQRKFWRQENYHHGLW
jgi:predicted DNA binding protein